MPGTPGPVGVGPSNVPAFWNAVLTAIAALQQQVNQLTSGAQYQNVVDQYGSTQYVIGSLNQVVVIGAAFGQAGVQVGTALPAAGKPNVGIAKQTNLATTTVTLTKGSTAATVASGAGITNGMVIGAANVSDPSSGVATPAITPGTTVQSGGGTASLTLSQAAAESGTGIYCAACLFTVV